jgi:ATP-binding cassette subfamily G (WHITE) protein 2 (SNQ2)
MGTVLGAPLGQQIVVPLIKLRSIYEIRERPSRTYSWSALLTAQMVTELLWNLIGSSLFFVCWYWTVGFETSRAGYTYLMLCIAYPFFYTTLSAMSAALAPNPEIGALVYSLFLTFTFTFNGVTQPFRFLGWWKWTYHVSPFTYLIQGLVGQTLGRQRIECAPKEYAIAQPSSGQSCSAFFAQFIQQSGGYLSNPDAMSDCSFCSARTTDELFGPSFNIYWSQHWRDLGIMCAYILFNFTAAYLLTYIFRVRSGNPIHFYKGLRDRRRAAKA